MEGGGFRAHLHVAQPAGERGVGLGPRPETRGVQLDGGALVGIETPGPVEVEAQGLSFAFPSRSIYVESVPESLTSALPGNTP